MQHHPEILINHTQVTVTLYTRDLNDVTERDIELSKKIDEIIEDINVIKFSRLNMSFFVSDSLKGIINEEDLAARDNWENQLKGNSLLTIRFHHPLFQSFKCELIKMSFN